MQYSGNEQIREGCCDPVHRAGHHHEGRVTQVAEELIADCDEGEPIGKRIAPEPLSKSAHHEESPASVSVGS